METFRLRLVFFFLIILVGLGLLVYYSMRNAQNLTQTTGWVEHTQQVIYECELLLSSVKDIESGSRGFVITSDSVYLAHFFDAANYFDEHISRLRELTADNPDQQLRIDSLQPLVLERLHISQEVVEKVKDNKTDEAIALIRQGKGHYYMEQIRSLLERIVLHETNLLTQRKESQAASEEKFQMTFYFLLFLIILFIAATFIVVTRHISFRKKTAEELFIKNELYSQTLLSIGDGVITTDREGNITFLNKTAIELTGWKPEEAMGQPVEEVFCIHEETTGRLVANPLREAIQRNEVIWLANHTVLRRKDGSEIFIDDSGAPIHNLQGQIIGGVLIFRDISERKKAEKALKASFEKFKAFYENSMAGIFLTAPDGRIFSANPAACHILQRSEEEICRLGRNGLLDLADTRIETFLQQRRLHGRATGEMTMIRKGGEKFPAEVSSAIFTDQSGEERTCLIFQDITERKLAEKNIQEMNAYLEEQVALKTKEVIEKEQRYRQALDHMMEGVQIIGFDWRYLYVNDTVERQSKYSRDQLLGHTMMEMYPGIEHSKLFEALRQCMEHREPQHIENEFEFPDGSKGWFELSIQPVPDGIFILSIDITKRKKAELNLQNKNQELSKTNAELDRFVYSVSHDLRAPLTSLLGLLNLTMKEVQLLGLKGQEEKLQMMKRSVMKLDEFIADILDYSRNARLDMKAEIIDMRTLLEEVKDNVQHLATNARLSLNIQPEAAFASDPSRIRIIATNLISNALKYSDHTKANPEITIDVKIEPEKMRMAVKDNGIGVAAEDQERIFRMFERVSTQSNGSGIGLYIVKECVARLGGEIYLESQLKIGSTFTVILPNLIQHYEIV